jgi:hypothetical protein
MTYGRVLFVQDDRDLDGAAKSHLAELVRGDSFAMTKGPLIRPSGTFSPRGEGSPWLQGETKGGVARRLGRAKRRPNASRGTDVSGRR